MQFLYFFGKTEIYYQKHLVIASRFDYIPTASVVFRVVNYFKRIYGAINK